MNASLRPALVLVVAVPLAVCVFVSRFACDSTDLRELVRGLRRGEELEDFRQAGLRHRVSKEQVVQELIGGRCSLSEALARWQELDHKWIQELERERPELAIGISQMYRLAWSDADYYYRNIIELAAELLRDRPEEAASVLRLLERDYQQLQAERQMPSTALTDWAAPHR
jgi:hypothetical protein